MRTYRKTGSLSGGRSRRLTSAGALLATLFVAAALPSGFAWLAFGATMQRRLQSARAARIFNTVMGATLGASVALIIW
jgi:threonine/homoserine/homoserine lactone efflux protein